MIQPKYRKKGELKMLTVKKIIKAIGHPHLNLYRGEGYQYFVYDNGKEGIEMVYSNGQVTITNVSDSSVFIQVQM